jgi:DNA-binding MarR family transcriptional regulator
LTDNKMNDATIDRILENMVHIMPVFHRRILRMDLGGVTDNLTRLHFAIMGGLSQTGMTMSELAKISMMTKPQMTHLIGQLVGLGIVERCPDAKDRRVINLALTDKGCVLLEDMKRKVTENIRNRLASLTAEELTQMSAALDTLREIGSKL